MDENNRFKKILIIFLFLAVVGVCGYFIWLFFFKPVLTAPGQVPGATTTPAGLPAAQNGKGQVGTTTTPGGVPTATSTGQTPAPQVPKGVTVNPLSKQTTVLNANPSLKPVLSGDGKSLKFYDQTDNKFYKIDGNGNKVLLSNQTFYNVQNVNWSPDTNKAVLEYPDGSKIVYDFTTNKQSTLPKHWEDFNFSTDSSKLVMKSMGADVENRWLITANADGSQAQALEYIGANADTVIPSWSPNNQSVAMYTQGMDLNRQEVFFVGQNKENFKSTVVEGRGFQPLWSKTGDTLLYSVYSSDTNSNPSLWIVDAQGDSIGNNRQQLDLQTWADKCTFATDKQIYCAVPNSLQPGSGIVPDLAKNTQDTLYKIDLENGTKQQVAIPDGSYNISNLIVSDNQNQLFFTDATTNQIYKIDLK
jgi:hypothetical protein